MNGVHISVVPIMTTRYVTICEPDGICHCEPAPTPHPIGECPRCRRLALSHASGRALLIASGHQEQPPIDTHTTT